MKTKILLVVTLYFFSINSYSQSESEIQKSISIIEDLYYSEVYLGEKTYQKLNISIDRTTNKITFNKFHFSATYLSTEYIDSFYLDDFDNSLMVVKLIYFGDIDSQYKEKDMFAISIELKTKDNSIKSESIEINKRQFPYPINKTEYRNKLFINNFNNPPKNICKKFVDNFIILLNIKNVKYMVYNKAADDYKEATNPL